MREPRTILASVAAVGGVVAASSCCLPLLPFMMAAGLAGGAAFLWAVRPYLLASSILFIAYGLYQAYQAKKCQRRPAKAAAALLWVSAAFVVISVLFPQVMANMVAGGSQTPSGQQPLESLTTRNVAEVRNAFNAAKGDVRVLLLLSPT